MSTFSATIPRMASLIAIVKQLEAERDRLDKAIRALKGVHHRAGIKGKRRTVSMTARRRMAAAQRARWAKVKAGKK
jgi:hypothetical protein